MAIYSYKNARKMIKKSNWTPIPRNYFRVPKSTKSYVRRAIAKSEETKYFDVTLGITASSSSFGAQALTNAIVQGTSRNQRIGAKIRLVGFRYLIELTPGDNENVCRLLFLKYRPGGVGPATISALTALIGAVNTDTFQPIRDWVAEPHFAPVDGSTSATISVNRYYRGFIKATDLLNYGIGSSSVQNSYYIQLHSDSAIAPNPGIGGFVRIFYKDA